MGIDYVGGREADICSGSLAELLSDGLAKVISEHVVCLRLPPPPTLYVRLDVTFLGTSITNSNNVFQWRSEPSSGGGGGVPNSAPSASVPPSHHANNSTALRDLDTSDLKSLDLTSRAAPALNTESGGRLKASRPSNLSQVGNLSLYRISSFRDSFWAK